MQSYLVDWRPSAIIVSLSINPDTHIDTHFPRAIRVITDQRSEITITSGSSSLHRRGRPRPGLYNTKVNKEIEKTHAYLVRQQTVIIYLIISFFHSPLLFFYLLLPLSFCSAFFNSCFNFLYFTRLMTPQIASQLASISIYWFISHFSVSHVYRHRKSRRWQ